MSVSSDDEGEFIRKYITVTRSGRRSVPPLRQETDKVRTDRRQNTQRRNRQATVNMGGVNVTGQQVAQLLQNRSTTIIGTDSPKFRGRKRQNDPPFEDQNSFRQHLSLVNNYISTLNNPSEQEKKNRYC